MANYLTITGKDSTGSNVSILWAAVTGKGTLYLGDLLSSNETLGGISQVLPGIRLGVVSGVPAVIIPDDSPYRLSLDGLLKTLNTLKNNGASESDIAEYLQKLYDSVSKQYPTFPSTDELIKLYRNKEDFLDPYFAGTLPIKINVSATYYVKEREAVVAAVSKMNSSSEVSVAYVGNTLNKTVKQELPTDRFFIALPKYESLKDDYSPNLIPDMMDVFVPFNHPSYYGPFWMNLKDKSESERLEYLGYLSGRDDIKMRPEDVTQFVDYPVTHILGNDDNNELPIMDNEVDYYNALIRLIKFDLETCFPGKSEMLYDSGALSDHMRYYLESLMKGILYLNWSCSGMFKIFKVDLDSDDDDLDTDADDRLVYEYHRDTNPSGFNGIEFVLGWIKGAAQGNSGEGGKPLGCGVYVEAIIKLARWGDRKPRCLKLDGKDLMFNLTKFRESIPQIDFSKLYPIKVNGRELSLGGIIESQVRVKDSVFCEELGVSGSIMCPVGFITVKFFANDQSQINYVSLADAVSEYRKGNYFIDGLDFVNGKFVVDEARAQAVVEPMVMVTANVLNLSGCAYYITPELENFAQEVGVKVSYMNDLHVLDSISKSENIISIYYKDVIFTSKESLKQRVAEFATLPVKVVMVNIGHRILPLYLKISDEWDGNGISSLLDQMLLNMETLGFEFSTDFYGKVTGDVSNAAESVVHELSVFGKPKEKEKIMVDLSPLIVEVEPSDTVYRVLKNPKTNGVGEEVCYIASRTVTNSVGKKIPGYIFIGKEEFPDGMYANADVVMEKLVPHLWRIFASVMMNRIENPSQIRFVSQKTALQVYDLVKLP